MPNLVYAAPGDAGWQEFWFYHYQDHLEIVQALAKLNFQVTNYIIDPWTTDNKEQILELHQQYHNDMNQILGIAGSDLSELDFKKANEVKAWLYLNYNEHLGVHTTLDI